MKKKKKNGQTTFSNAEINFFRFFKREVYLDIEIPRKKFLLLAATSLGPHLE